VKQALRVWNGLNWFWRGPNGVVLWWRQCLSRRNISKASLKVTEVQMCRLQSVRWWVKNWNGCGNTRQLTVLRHYTRMEGLSKPRNSSSSISVSRSIAGKQFWWGSYLKAGEDGRKVLKTDLVKEFNCMRSEVLTAETMSMLVYWVVTPCLTCR
jgi:hypothetical protein